MPGSRRDHRGVVVKWLLRLMLRILLITLLMLSSMGCNMLPDVAHQPMVHNPFPQLSRVAVAPFFNLSNEKTVDVEQFANAYFSELQTVQGFEVIPPNVVMEAVIEHQLSLDSPQDVRRLAQLLHVDAVVVGAVTEFTPYYPPRVGLKVDWFAANPCFHPIPPGYGLPWGTAEEEFIPEPLVFEAEFALAKAQLKTQTPAGVIADDELAFPPSDSGQGEELPAPDADTAPEMDMAPDTGFDADPRSSMDGDDETMDDEMLDGGEETIEEENDGSDEFDADAETEELLPMAYEEEIPYELRHGSNGVAGAGVAGGTITPQGTDLPENWPDERAFVPPMPSADRPKCKPYNGPVMTHTRLYAGDDAAVTEALASYVFFRDDARQGGWQSYLKRSDDFIRFCCRMHIFETLTARGGGGKTRVVWRWPESRYQP